MQISKLHVYAVQDGKVSKQPDPALLRTKVAPDSWTGKLRSAALPACLQPV